MTSVNSSCVLFFFLRLYLCSPVHAERFALHLKVVICLNTSHEKKPLEIPITLTGSMMKKTFKLTHAKLKVPRLVDSIKHEVKKYLKRERKKSLPEGADYWDFDCRFGADEATSEVVHVATLNTHISKAELDQLESFYIEILAKPAQRNKKPVE